MAHDAPEMMIVAEDDALYLQVTTMAVARPHGHPLVTRGDPRRATTTFSGTITLKTGQEVVMEAATMSAAATAAHLRAVVAADPTYRSCSCGTVRHGTAGPKFRGSFTPTRAWTDCLPERRTRPEPAGTRLESTASSRASHPYPSSTA